MHLQVIKTVLCIFVCDQVLRLNVLQSRLHECNGKMVIHGPVCAGMRFGTVIMAREDGGKDIGIDAIEDQSVLQFFSPLSEAPVSLTIFWPFTDNMLGH